MPQPRTVTANGVPQLVKLSYLEGISTWGPTSAEGVLEFSFAEGFLRLEAEGLPRLVGQAYEGWLVRSASNEALSVGQFNAAADETIAYEAQLPPITDYSLDFFVLTVESLSNGDADPSDDRSIGGFFNVLAPEDPDSSASEIAPGTPTNLGGSGESPSATSPSGAEPSPDSSAETPHLTDAITAAPSSPTTVAPNGALPQTLPETGDPDGFLSSIRGIALILAGGARAGAIERQYHRHAYRHGRRGAGLREFTADLRNDQPGAVADRQRCRSDLGSRTRCPWPSKPHAAACCSTNATWS